MASKKFKGACIIFATKNMQIDVYKVITAAQKDPDDLYKLIREKGWRWNKQRQMWTETNR